ncbi:MAG: FGGY-family carbohydrate kinase, partial [Pseudomonadota bacterium]
GPAVFRVDGGMAGNDWFLGFLASVLDTPVERPANIESTVLGAASLAGLRAGVLKGIGDLQQRWQSERIFEPDMTPDVRDQLLAGWSDAVSRTRGAR